MPLPQPGPIMGVWQEADDDAHTLQVLREHRETLVSVMETFVHDPLCEWTKRHRSSEETDNPQAKDALATLEGVRSYQCMRQLQCALTP